MFFASLAARHGVPFGKVCFQAGYLSHRKLLRIPYETKRSAGCALADKKIAYAILLARLSSATLPSGLRGMGEPKSACGLCSE